MSSQPHKPDFHVVALNYDIEHDSTVSYDNPEPIEFANAIAVFRLNSGSLRCELKQHFDDPAKACELIEPTLRAWELDADLRYGRNQLRFKFRNSDVIDRSPVLPETIRGYAMMGGVGGFGILGTATVHLTKKRYPEPPTTFAITPIVKTIASRFQRYQDGNEPLPAMAYFCLTVIKDDKSLENVAKDLNIDTAILRKISELSTNRGGIQMARKASGAQLPLSGNETAWLEGAVKELILLVGDTRPANTRPRLTMNDLPPL